MMGFVCVKGFNESLEILDTTLDLVALVLCMLNHYSAQCIWLIQYLLDTHPQQYYIVLPFCIIFSLLPVIYNSIQISMHQAI